MKFITAILLAALLGYGAYLFAAETPWWLFMIGALLIGMLVPQAAWKNMLAVFVTTGVLWAILMYMANTANHGIMAEKMASILKIEGSVELLILISALSGALLAGFAALTGSFLRKKAR